MKKGFMMEGKAFEKYTTSVNLNQPAQNAGEYGLAKGVVKATTNDDMKGTAGSKKMYSK